MTKDYFIAQPITHTIVCPSCGETLLFGVEECRFCHTQIDEAYAKESVQYQALITNAVKSANIIRSLRNLLYILLAMTVFAFFKDPPYLEILLVISVINLIGPIRWLRKYAGKVPGHDDILAATKAMRIEVYLWLGTIILQIVALLLWLFNR